MLWGGPFWRETQRRIESVGAGASRVIDPFRRATGCHRNEPNGKSELFSGLDEDFDRHSRSEHVGLFFFRPVSRPS